MQMPMQAMQQPAMGMPGLMNQMQGMNLGPNAQPMPQQYMQVPQQMQGMPPPNMQFPHQP